MTFLSNLSMGSIQVWRRNRDVFFKTWKTNFLPSIFEPLLYLIAMGLGFGVLLTAGVPYAGQTIDYIRFLAPGLIAISAMYGAFFECTYGSFVRMHYQKTFDAIIATPVSIEDVITGEILWGATKAFLNSTIVLVVIELMGVFIFPTLLFDSLTILLVPVLAFLAGLMFAAIAMIFTAIVPNIDSFNYPFFLLISPMFLFSGTFFPIEVLPAIGQDLAFVLPLTHVATAIRDMSFGFGRMLDVYGVVFIIIMTVVAYIPAIRLMKKRLIS